MLKTTEYQYIFLQAFQRTGNLVVDMKCISVSRHVVMWIFKCSGVVSKLCCKLVCTGLAILVVYMTAWCVSNLPAGVHVQDVEFRLFKMTGVSGN